MSLTDVSFVVDVESIVDVDMELIEMKSWLEYMVVNVSTHCLICEKRERIVIGERARMNFICG